MLKFGVVKEVDASKGLAKVTFNEDDFVSGYLPIIQTSTLKNRVYKMLDVNEHVVCLMDENAENGVILGAIYSDADATPLSDKDTSGTVYNTTDSVTFKRTDSARLWKVKVGVYEISVGSSGKIKISNTTETLKAVMGDFISAVSDFATAAASETHAVSGSATAIPNNVSDYVLAASKLAAIKSRMEALLS